MTAKRATCCDEARDRIAWKICNIFNKVPCLLVTELSLGEGEHVGTTYELDSQWMPITYCPWCGRRVADNE